MTAISAHDQPTVPSVLLLILSLVFFFYGESSILMPQLRNQVYVVLGIILSWVFSIHLWVHLPCSELPKSALLSRLFFNYLGMTNIFNISKWIVPPQVYLEPPRSRGILGITVFWYYCKFDCIDRRLGPLSWRAFTILTRHPQNVRLFHHNLQAAINFQQKLGKGQRIHFKTGWCDENFGH